MRNSSSRVRQHASNFDTTVRLDGRSVSMTDFPHYLAARALSEPSDFHQSRDRVFTPRPISTYPPGTARKYCSLKKDYLLNNHDNCVCSTCIKLRMDEMFKELFQDIPEVNEVATDSTHIRCSLKRAASSELISSKRAAFSKDHENASEICTNKNETLNCWYREESRANSARNLPSAVLFGCRPKVPGRNPFRSMKTNSTSGGHLKSNYQVPQQFIECDRNIIDNKLWRNPAYAASIYQAPQIEKNYSSDDIASVPFYFEIDPLCESSVSRKDLGKPLTPNLTDGPFLSETFSERDAVPSSNGILEKTNKYHQQTNRNDYCPSEISCLSADHVLPENQQIICGLLNDDILYRSITCIDEDDDDPANHIYDTINESYFSSSSSYAPTPPPKRNTSFLLSTFSQDKYMLEDMNEYLIPIGASQQKSVASSPQTISTINSLRGIENHSFVIDMEDDTENIYEKIGNFLKPQTSRTNELLQSSPQMSASNIVKQSFARGMHDDAEDIYEEIDNYIKANEVSRSKASACPSRKGSTSDSGIVNPSFIMDMNTSENAEEMYEDIGSCLKNAAVASGVRESVAWSSRTNSTSDSGVVNPSFVLDMPDDTEEVFEEMDGHLKLLEDSNTKCQASSSNTISANDLGIVNPSFSLNSKCNRENFEECSERRAFGNSNKIQSNVSTFDEPPEHVFKMDSSEVNDLPKETEGSTKLVTHQILLALQFFTYLLLACFIIYGVAFA